MSQYRTDDPDMVRRKEVNDNGQIYLGTEFAGDEVEVSVKRTTEGSDE